jgi:streptogramin lyase
MESMVDCRIKSALLTSVTCLGLTAGDALAERVDLGGGFRLHGVATPVSNHRGTVATVDGDGRNVVLVWLFDHRGGYALLMIDADTGESEQFPVPFPPGGDCPSSSILSSRNKFYTHFNSHFVEFDPEKRAFTFCSRTAPQMAMGMTEDDDGVIWSVTYPKSGVVSFDPRTREFKDYGHVHQENWAQYQRYVAADDAGWIYFGIGSTLGQIIAFDPRTATAKPMIPQAERTRGSGSFRL